MSFYNEPERTIWNTCEHCGEPIFDGDEGAHMSADMEPLHEECIDEFAREKLGATRVSTGP